MARIPASVANIRARYADHYVVRNLRAGFARVFSKRSTKAAFFFLLIVLFLGLVGQHVTPYGYDETLYDEDGQVLRNEDPSLAHPLGTTPTGLDVFSRLIYGAQPTVITGLLGGTMIVTIGLTIGVTAGYVGGWVDSVLMRVTDVAYSVPLIPFAIVLLALFGFGFLTSVLVIGLLLWRANARVLRSQVLQIKERPFIQAAVATGASRLRIIVKHVLPNIASMAILFFALGVGYSIIAQAGLAFIGVSNPFVPSWGVMIRNAYQSGYVAELWTWSIIPGLMIAFTVLSAFILGREFEEIDTKMAA